MKELPVSYQRILTRLEAKEARLLRHRPISPLEPWSEAIRGKIPPTLSSTLEKAFSGAFALLMGPNGTTFLERTYARRGLDRKAALWEQPLSPAQARKLLRDMERQRTAGTGLDSLLAGAEGTVLGLLGIGLPDIPVFLAWLLRSLFQNGRRYGFPCESDAERVYLLLLLRGSLTAGEEREALSRRADRLGRALDHGWETSFQLEDEIAETARLLSDRLLLVKFIQGLPLVGVVGGVSNLSLSAAVGRYGAIKYKKRFLERKVRGL